MNTSCLGMGPFLLPVTHAVVLPSCVFALLLWVSHGLHTFRGEWKSLPFGFGLSRWEGLVGFDPHPHESIGVDFPFAGALWVLVNLKGMAGRRGSSLISSKLQAQFPKQTVLQTFPWPVPK